jgi:hypothetical protein
MYHSKKNSVTYYHKCTQVCMYSTRYSFHILLNLHSLKVTPVLASTVQVHSHTREQHLLLSSCPSVRLHQSDIHWTDFHEVWHWGLLWKFVEELQIWLKIEGKKYRTSRWHKFAVQVFLYTTQYCYTADRYVSTIPTEHNDAFPLQRLRKRSGNSQLIWFFHPKVHERSQVPILGQVKAKFTL